MLSRLSATVVDLFCSPTARAVNLISSEAILDESLASQLSPGGAGVGAWELSRQPFTKFRAQIINIVTGIHFSLLSSKFVAVISFHSFYPIGYDLLYVAHRARWYRPPYIEFMIYFL